MTRFFTCISFAPTAAAAAVFVVLSCAGFDCFGAGRNDARSQIEARIDTLTRIDIEYDSKHTDAARLRRDTLALIRAAIASKDE
jgi:hypothetical protein